MTAAEDRADAAALARRGMVLVQCTGVSRSGLVREFGVTLRDWAELPATVRVSFTFPPRGRRTKEVIRAVELTRARSDRDAGTALYVERGVRIKGDVAEKA